MNNKEALDSLTQIAGSLDSLSQAFYKTGNEKVGGELRWLSRGIVEAVDTIREGDREKLWEEAQQLNKLSASLLTAMLDKEQTNEF
jgi:hypothetical protein